MDIHFQHRIWHSTAIDGLTVVSGIIWRHCYPMHLHDAVEILCVVDGRARMVCRDYGVNIGKGEVGVVRPNQLHSGLSMGSKPARFLLIHVPTALFRMLAKNLDPDRSLDLQLPPIQALKDCGLNRLFTELAEELGHTGNLDGQTSILERLLTQIVSVSSGRVQPNIPVSASHPAIRKAVNVLRSETDDDVKIKDLSQRVGLNERYFIPLFKSATGLSPHQFHIALRIDTARTLIQRDTPLSMAANMAGFSDQSHFTRHFKRQYGTTPGQFQQSFSPDLNFIL